MIRSHIIKDFRRFILCKDYFTKMPKNKPKKCTKAAIGNECIQNHIGPVKENKDGTYTLNILAKPGARNNSITDVNDESVGVQIAAAPVDGEANKELIKYLSKVFDLRKSDVNIEKGSKSRMKTVIITDSSKSLDDILEILRKQVGE